MNIYKLRGKIQHYAWGGHSFIPSLLKIDNSKDLPFAEYWLGTHVLAPSAIAGSQKSLTDITGEHKLPFLLKILDVKDMLSIQVHPSKKSAEEMFAAENKAGIPIDAPHRNYKDDNHKPELVVALGEFWLLHGFKQTNELKETLQSVPELNFLLDFFANGNYETLYRTVMSMPQEEVNLHLQPLLDRIIPLYEKNELKKNTPDFWAARAAKTFNTPGGIDRGIFSIYFFNLVQLKEGEGLFQDAGVPHAYLEGQNVEIMANSDNVLRGGLTFKHVDVPELMKHIKFEGIDPDIQKPGEKQQEAFHNMADRGEKQQAAIHSMTHMGEKQQKEQVYQTPVDDFKLSCFRLKKREQAFFSTQSFDILLQITGKITLSDSLGKINLSSGEAAVILPETEVGLYADEDALVFRATSG